MRKLLKLLYFILLTICLTCIGIAIVNLSSLKAEDHQNSIKYIIIAAIINLIAFIYSIIIWKPKH